MNSGRSLITLSCIGFVCLPVLLVWAATYINKPARQTVRLNKRRLSFSSNASLDLRVRSELDWMKFQQLGSRGLILRSLWEMPNWSAFFQKHPTCLNPSAEPLKCQDSYFQAHSAVFSHFTSWRYAARTAGLCHSLSSNVFIFTPNVRRVEVLWLRKTDRCSSTVGNILLPSLRKKYTTTHIPRWHREGI